MAANKVIVNNQTIIDLTADTVTAATLKKGVTAHDASGAQITGTMEEASTSETWVLKAELAIPDDHVSYPVDATMYSNNYQRDVNVVQIDMASEHLTFFVLNDDNNRDSVNGYAYGEWYDNSYRKLVFNVPPTGDLLTWLTANGVKQPANLAVQPSKDVTITSNGTTEITPDAPYDALSSVDVTVNVSGGGGGVETCTLTTLLGKSPGLRHGTIYAYSGDTLITITSKGTYSINKKSLIYIDGSNGQDKVTGLEKLYHEYGRAVYNVTSDIATYKFNG